MREAIRRVQPERKVEQRHIGVKTRWRPRYTDILCLCVWAMLAGSVGHETARNQALNARVRLWVLPADSGELGKEGEGWQGTHSGLGRMTW